MEDDAVVRAYRRLRGTTRGDLRFDDHVRPIRYVICPDGRMVAPVMVAMLRSEETVLFVPSCEENALEMLVSLEEFDERGPGGAHADRWRIWHGEPEDVRWAFIDIEAARFEDAVLLDTALLVPNPLAEEEPRICREINARTDELRSLVRRARGDEIESPTMVGIDPGGIDVRGRFGVVRIEMPEPMLTADEARRVLEASLSEPVS